MELSCCHLPQFLRFGDFVTYSTSSSSSFASSRPIMFQSIFCNSKSLIRSSPHRCQHHRHHSRRLHRSKMSTCADHISPRAVYNDEQQPCILSARETQVGIIMGSDSDLPVMKAAAELLETFNVAYELTVVSAHRTPERMVEYAKTAHVRGIKVIIAGAGGAAHLPGMVAAMTPLPVIGVPVRGSSLDGLDSLLSIVQMPRGVPVATVAINNAMNAGLLAVRILSSFDVNLRNKILEHQNNMKSTVLEKAERLEDVGWQAYT